MTETLALLVLMAPLALVVVTIGVYLYRTSKRPKPPRLNEAQQLMARLTGVESRGDVE